MTPGVYVLVILACLKDNPLICEHVRSPGDTYPTPSMCLADGSQSAADFLKKEQQYGKVKKIICVGNEHALRRLLEQKA